jgi:hypothetical protein
VGNSAVDFKINTYKFVMTLIFTGVCQMKTTTFSLAIGLSSWLASSAWFAGAQVLKKMIISAPITIEWMPPHGPRGWLIVKNDKNEEIGTIKKLDFGVQDIGLIKNPGEYTLEFYPHPAVKLIDINLRISYDKDSDGKAGVTKDFSITGNKNEVTARQLSASREEKSTHTLTVSNKTGEPLFILK